MREFFTACEIVHFIYTTVAILAGCGVAVGAEKDWSGSTPEKVVTIVKEIPVEKVVEAEEPIVWKKEFLDADQPSLVQDSGQLRWIIESNDACGICTQNWSTLANDKVMQSEGWTFGLGGHFQKQEVPLDHPLPVWKLMRGDVELERRVGYQAALPLKTSYIDAYNKTLKTIDAGTVSREQVELVLSFIGKSGTYRGSNVKRSIPVSGITADLPANLGADWSTDATGNLRVKLTPSASGRWGLIALSVSGLVYDGKTIMIQTPMSFMNPVLTVK